MSSHQNCLHLISTSVLHSKQFVLLQHARCIRMQHPFALDLPLIACSRSGLAWQVYVDIDTPSSLWDTLRTECETYLGDHPEYYTGNCAVFAFGANDPLKLQLGIYFEYSFNGELLRCDCCPAALIRSHALALMTA